VSGAPFARRLAAVTRAAEQQGADAVLITNSANILYLCGFGGSAARLLATGGQLYFITDFRYSRSVAGLARSWPPHSQVVETKGSYDEATAEVVRGAGVAVLAFEAGHVSVSQHRAWEAGLRGVRLVATEKLVERQRLIKEEGELQVLRDAGRRISRIAASLTEWVRRGRQEREIAADINHAMAREGFSRPAFETIVASGPSSALPHARPGNRRLERGDLVVVDFGGVLDGYAVDITRTLSVGAPDHEAGRLHAAVLEAQTAAARALKPGQRVQDVDLAARAVLEARGFGGAVRHATGHGLGLDVHEEPRLSRDAPAEAPLLAAGMVVTIEPGAYIDAPEGSGRAMGVRIEDDLVVAGGEPEWLTSAPRDLVVVNG
jgi:Xaa-Pro aminopeptidase